MEKYVNYEIVQRSQHARQGRSGFHGPDTCLSLVLIPLGSEPVGDHPLSKCNIRKYGWNVAMQREVYGASRGPRSIYMAAIREMEQRVKDDYPLAAIIKVLKECA